MHAYKWPINSPRTRTTRTATGGALMASAESEGGVCVTTSTRRASDGGNGGNSKPDFSLTRDNQKLCAAALKRRRQQEYAHRLKQQQFGVARHTESDSRTCSRREAQQLRRQQRALERQKATLAAGEEADRQRMRRVDQDLAALDRLSLSGGSNGDSMYGSTPVQQITHQTTPPSRAPQSRARRAGAEHGVGGPAVAPNSPRQREAVIQAQAESAISRIMAAANGSRARLGALEPSSVSSDVAAAAAAATSRAMSSTVATTDSAITLADTRAASYRTSVLSNAASGCEAFDDGTLIAGTPRSRHEPVLVSQKRSPGGAPPSSVQASIANIRAMADASRDRLALIR